jgi:Tol biopolymer transport system component
MINRHLIISGIIIALCLIIVAQIYGQQVFDRGYHVQWSPDGQKIACADWVNGQAEMWIISLDDTSAFEVTPGVHGDYYISWMPNSEEVIFDASETNGPGNLWRININQSTPEIVANPLSIMPTVSPDGNYVAFCNGHDIIKKSLINGVETNLSNHWAFDFHPAWSLDGSKVLFSSERSGNRDIWYVSSNGGIATQVTFDQEEDDRASWHPNSSDITFVSDRTGIESIFIVNINSSTPEIFVEDASYPTWLYDGSKMAYANHDGIWIMDVEPVGIDKQNNVQEINVYPNPAKESITIEISALKSEIVRMALISMSGETIFEKNIAMSSVPKNICEISFPSTITSGVYFLKLCTKNKTLLRKVSILR